MASIFWHIVILEIHVALEIQFFFVCVYLEGCMVHYLPYVSCILKNRATFLHVADNESRDSYH
jgi:hypothetical protein